MEELEKIIANFLGKNVNQINESTIINNSAIPGSILIHRMYAAMSKAGFQIQDYSSINTYGDLLDCLGNNSGKPVSQKIPVVRKQPSDNILNSPGSPIYTGIDIESDDSLPKVNDLREDAFYINNFTSKEIAYALLKKNPYETLSGLFSAKEAICKADNWFRSKAFNEIEIEHNADGAPVFEGFAISVSHSKGFSIAVAIKNQHSSMNKNSSNSGITKQNDLINSDPVKPQKSFNKISFIMSIVAMLVSLFLLLFNKRS